MSKRGPKPKIQDSDAPELLHRYRAGESPAVLAAELEVHRSTLKGFLRRHGLVEDENQQGGDVPVTPEVAAQIVRRYCELKDGPKKLGEDYGVCKRTIHNLVRRAGFEVRSEKGVHFPSRSDAFDVLTPEAAYWAGMLMADGCISESKKTQWNCQPQLILVLNREDEHHITRFQQFIGATQHKVSQIIIPARAVGYRTSLASRLAVVSGPICRRLTALGITARKTFTAVASAELAIDRDFWRGVSDGDGCVHATCAHDVLGSEALCRQYVAYIERTAPGAVYDLHPRAGCWSVSVNSNAARRMLAHLYQDGDVSLGRKHERARHWAAGRTSKLPLYKDASRG
jgi:hypothetical protein